MRSNICISFLSICIVLASCESDDATPTTAANDDFDTTTATLLRTGMWMGNSSYRVSGTAEIYESAGQRYLLLTDFQSSNGPDLRVYLSVDSRATSFVHLGRLKSTNGRQLYEIPSQTDVEQFKFALIWCQEFAVLFGKSETN